MIPLWPVPVDGEFQPHLIPFITRRDGPPAPAIIICPGGGYVCKVDHEKGNVAECFNKLGFNCFVLEYRLPAQTPYPAPQLDALRAVKLLRARAGEFNIDPNAITLMGFSAGGHLAATVSHLWETLDASAGDAADAFSARPDATVPAYAVTSGITDAHPESMRNLFGHEPNRAELESVSAELHMNARTPPSFIWHTADDAIVPVSHSVNYAAALSRAGVPFALHVFPFGAHGKTIATDDPAVGKWTELCAAFLRQVL